MAAMAAVAADTACVQVQMQFVDAQEDGATSQEPAARSEGPAVLFLVELLAVSHASPTRTPRGELYDLAKELGPAPGSGLGQNHSCLPMGVGPTVTALPGSSNHSTLAPPLPAAASRCYDSQTPTHQLNRASKAHCDTPGPRHARTHASRTVYNGFGFPLPFPASRY